jgi:peptide deformylase
MPVRAVRQLGDPVLRETACRVEDPSAPEVALLVRDLEDTLVHWRSVTGYGRGIAAPQLGVLMRAILLRLPGEDPWPLINPEIVERSEEKITVWDACLSFLCIFMQVQRHREVTVRYQDLTGTWHQIRAGLDRDLSELLQHEIDHLHGVLAIDRVTDLRAIVTKEEFEKRYKAESPYAEAGLGRNGPSAP